MTKDELIKAIVDLEFQRAHNPGINYRTYWTNAYQKWSTEELQSYALMIGAT